MEFISIRKIKQLEGKTVLLRVAYDVPLKFDSKKWVVADTRRIAETLPTIQYLLKKKAKVVLLSWLGRPAGKKVAQYQMAPVAQALSELLKKKVFAADDCIGPKVFKKIQALKKGELLMLENVRFYPEEEKNDKRFAKLLVHGIDLIVFDAFAQAHRSQASTVGIAALVPTYTGFLFEKEYQVLTAVSENPAHPLVVIVGGAKISDKVATLEHLLPRADKVLIGGGVANVFLKAKGVPVGASFVEDKAVNGRKQVDLVALAASLLKKYKNKIVLPIDLVSANQAEEKHLIEVIDLERKQTIESRWKFLDIGPKTVAAFLPEIKRAKTIIWNGPMGMFEIKHFSFGTKKIAQAIARSGAYSVVGGGDTERAIGEYNLTKKYGHVSTGGGASLEVLGGKTLPVTKHIATNTKIFK